MRLKFVVLSLFVIVIFAGWNSGVKAQGYDYANYTAPQQITLQPTTGGLCEFVMEITYPYDKATNWFVPYPYALSASDIVDAYLYQSRTGAYIDVDLVSDGFVWYSDSLSSDKDYLHFTVRVPTPSVSSVANESMAQVIVSIYASMPFESLKFNVSLPDGYWNFRIYENGVDKTSEFNFKVEYKQPPPYYRYPYATFVVPYLDYGETIRYDIIGEPLPNFMSVSLSESDFERLTPIVCDQDIIYRATITYPEPYLRYEIVTPFYNLKYAYISREETVYSGSIQQNKIYFEFDYFQQKDDLYVAREPPHLEIFPVEYTRARVVFKITITTSAIYTNVSTGRRDIPLGFYVGGEVEVYLLDFLGNDVSEKYNLSFWGDGFMFYGFTVTPAGETVFYLVIQQVQKEGYPEWVGLLGWVLAIAIVPLTKRIKDPKKRVRIIMIAMIFAIVWMFVHPYILKSTIPAYYEQPLNEVPQIENTLTMRLIVAIFFGIFILFILFLIALKITKLEYWFGLRTVK